MKPSYLVALAPLLLVAPAALAQGTSEQRAACAGDAWRLCRSEFPNIDGITACMKRERDKLGEACRLVLIKSEQEETKQAAAPAKAEPKTEQATAPAAATSTPGDTAAAPARDTPAETPAAAGPERKTAETPAPAEPTRAVASAPVPAARPAPAAPSTAPLPPARQQTARRETTAPGRIASRPSSERPVTSRETQRVAGVDRSRVTRQVASRTVAREDDHAIREADQWMRRLGLGGLDRETVRDMRRIEAFFDGRL